MPSVAGGIEILSKITIGKVVYPLKFYIDYTHERYEEPHFEIKGKQLIEIPGAPLNSHDVFAYLYIFRENYEKLLFRRARDIYFSKEYPNFRNFIE